MAPIWIAFVVLAALGGAAWWFLGQQGDQPEPTVSEPVAAAPEQPAEVAPEPEAAPEPEPEPEAAPEPEPEEQPAAAAPVDDLDLLTFPDEAKLPGTSDEDWTEIQEWMATFIDPNAGAAGNRARAKLLERGRESFPAILNGFKRIDFSTEAGMRTGDLCQRLLMDICGGSNFDWHYTIEPADVLFNKKVVRSWIKAWEQARDFPQAWAKLTKSELADAEKLFEKTGPFTTEGGAPTPASGLDDF